MKYEIVPSMLSVENELARYIDMLKGKVESVHIDVMDGIFVDRKAFGVDAIVELDTYLKLVVHLMAEPVGVWWSYAFGLSTGIGWNALLWGLRQWRRK